MWHKKLLPIETNYQNFIDALQKYRSEVFELEFAFQLCPLEERAHAFKYCLSEFLKYLKTSYIQTRMDLLQPSLLLGIEKEVIFVSLSGGNHLPHLKDLMIPIYFEKFNLPTIRRHYYESRFNIQKKRLEFNKTNLIPLHRW
jgi:hypothetical protein